MNSPHPRPSLRLITRKQPAYGRGEPEYPLDALELIPGIGTHPDHDVYMLVSYDDLATDKVEGDGLYLSLQEALTGAADIYDIERADWLLPPGFDSIEVAYTAILEDHVARYGRPAPHPAAA
jgi:hypothetical protein